MDPGLIDFWAANVSAEFEFAVEFVGFVSVSKSSVGNGKKLLR